MLQENYNSGYNSSANAASRGHGGFHGRGRGGHTGGRGSGGKPSPSNKTAGQVIKPTCQICKKKGHEAIDCWHRFEEDYQPNVKTTVQRRPAMASTRTGTLTAVPLITSPPSLRR